MLHADKHSIVRNRVWLRSRAALSALLRRELRLTSTSQQRWHNHAKHGCVLTHRVPGDACIRRTDCIRDRYRVVATTYRRHSMPAPVFNAVTLEMLWTRLISITDEAAAALVRTSFSTVVRESNDFACVLTDGDGLSLAQATDSIPSFIGTVPRTIRHFLEVFPAEKLAPEDILVTNDIWLGTGHLPDITVAKPIFYKHRLVGFA